MYNPPEYKEGDWHCQAVMGIDEVRILYATLDKFLKDDDVPEDHQSYLTHVHQKLFGMLQEYNFHSK